MRHSLNFALLDADGGLAAFARVVTDQATFALLSDVFVLEIHRGRGLGKRMVKSIMSHPDLQGLRRWMLVTQDAHQLYSRYADFAPLAAPERFMERFKPNPYGESLDAESKM